MVSGSKLWLIVPRVAGGKRRMRALENVIETTHIAQHIHKSSQPHSFNLQLFLFCQKQNYFLLHKSILSQPASHPYAY